MIKRETVLAIIPARGGSKGIPRKNVCLVAGKPLIAWTIKAAQQSKYIDRLILSSDDTEIIHVAREWGCEVPFVRPSHLARDDTPGMEPVFHALEHCPGFDMVVVLQPTSPCRSSQDIDACLKMLSDRQAQAVVSVTESPCHPAWTYRVESDASMHPYLVTDATRRQDLPPAFCLNGAVYAAACHSLIETRSFIADKTLAYLMPRERSVDIDDALDLMMAETLLERHIKSQ